ncbi:MAG: hypothetical protein EXS36_14610 [Pedosphaera sp.]|nr:hypothetical protein [Pedosphaera sp.]
MNPGPFHTTCLACRCRIRRTLCLVYGFLLSLAGHAAALSNGVINVSSNSTTSTPEALRDITGPVDIATRWTWVGRTAFAVALGLLAWWLWNLWQKKRANARAGRGISAEDRARERLREAWAHIANPPRFCWVVSVVVRDFLGDKFGWPASKQTTEEFLEEYASGNSLAPHHRNLLEDFLTRCDLVKFARYEAVRPELEDLHQAALRVVEETTAPQFSRPPMMGAGASPELASRFHNQTDAGAEPVLVGEERYMPRERPTLDP